MAIEIEVIKTEDGDIYCKPDPAHMILTEHDDKELKWKSEEEVGEFSLEFKTESPFVSGLKILNSTDREIEEAVKPHDEGQKDYAYYVSINTSAGQQLKADPGLIIKP